MRNFTRRLVFNSWYFLKAPWDSGISPPELIEFIDTHPAGRALDMGCGTGTNLITLAKAGWNASGVDFAPRAIRIAKRKLHDAGLQAELFTEDATRLTHISGSFDLVLDIGCYHGVHEKATYLTQLERVLAPNGYWLMYGFFKPSLQHSGPGLTSDDLELIETHNLKQCSRSDGFDRRNRPSAWFLFQKQLNNLN